MRVLGKQLKALSFGSAARMFGARQLLAAQAAEGYLSYDIKQQ